MRVTYHIVLLNRVAGEERQCWEWHLDRIFHEVREQTTDIFKEHSRGREEKCKYPDAREYWQAEENPSSAFFISRSRMIKKTYSGFHKSVYLEILVSHRPQVLNFSPIGTTAYKTYFDDPLYVCQGRRKCHFKGLFLRGAMPSCCHGLYLAPSTLKGDAPIATWILY